MEGVGWVPSASCRGLGWREATGGADLLRGVAAAPLRDVPGVDGGAGVQGGARPLPSHPLGSGPPGGMHPCTQSPKEGMAKAAANTAALKGPMMELLGGMNGLKYLV